MSEIEQLKKIVLNGEFDIDSRNDILKLEEELIEISAAEKLLLNPVIKRYVDYLNTEVERCTFLLSHDRKLTDVERQVLFEKREICEHFSSLFTGQKKELLEQQIKDLLDVARSQNNL